MRPSGVQSWAGGSCRSPDPQTPSAASGRAPTPRCWGPEHRAHTTPHTRQPQPAGERQKVCPCHESPPPQGPPLARAPTHTGTAVSPSRRHLDEVRGSSAVWAAVRPDNQGGYPVEPVRYGHTGCGSPPLAQTEIQTKPNPRSCTCTGRGLPKTAGFWVTFFVTKCRDLFL